MNQPADKTSDYYPTRKVRSFLPAHLRLHILIAVVVGLIPLVTHAETVYEIIGGMELVAIDSDTGDSVVVGPGTNNIYSMDFAPDGKLYGLRGQSGVIDLYEINTAVGGVSRIRTIPDLYATSLAISADGVFYATTRGTGSHLVTFDPFAPDHTPAVAVGAYVIQYPVSGIDFAADGTLYAITPYNDTLSTLDVLTGEQIPVGGVVGNLGLDIGGSDMSFTCGNTEIFITSWITGSGSCLIAVDPVTGQATIKLTYLPGNASASAAISDIEPPVFTVVPDDLTLDCGPDTQAEIDLWLAGAEATDDSGTVDISASIEWLGPCESGPAIVTWTATDVYGSQSTATANLTVNPDGVLTGLEFVEDSLQLTLEANGLFTATLTVSNTGDCPTEIGLAEIAASFAAPELIIGIPSFPITVCPGTSQEIDIVIDTTDALEGDYAAALNLYGSEGGALSLPISILISGELLPDLSANYTGGGVTVVPDSSPTSPAGGEGFTIHASIKNIGTAPAGAFTVKVYEGSSLLGSIEISGLAVNTSTQVQLPVPDGLDVGWYLIRVEVSPPDGGELRLKNNNSSALLQVGAPPIASAYVRITGSVSGGCGSDYGVLAVHAEYVLETGSSSVSYPMQGAQLSASIVGTLLGASGHTDVNGNFSASIRMPAPGTYDVDVEVTDFSITGQETLTLFVLAEASCGGIAAHPGEPDPVYHESLDLFVSSCDIHFTQSDGVTPLDLPASAGDIVNVGATIHYSTSVGRPLSPQPVHFIVRRQFNGNIEESFIGTDLAGFAGGGTKEVSVPWEVPDDGTYTILVTIDPNISQQTANDQATRAFISGIPPSPDTELYVIANGGGCSVLSQWVAGRATYISEGTPSLADIRSRVQVTAYDSEGALLGTSGVHLTDAAGYFSFKPGIYLSCGINTLVVEVTDCTLTGTAEYTTECHPDQNRPSPHTPPEAEQGGDMYVYAEHIAFLSDDCLSSLNRYPLPGETISVNANIHYYDGTGIRPLSAVPVDVNVLIPAGDELLTVPIASTTVDFDAGGAETVCIPWTPDVPGPQIVQVVIDPDQVYSFPFPEYAGNNAATRLIYVGQLDCLLSADPVEAVVMAGDAASYTITGETLGQGNPTLQLTLVPDGPSMPTGVTASFGAGQLTLPDDTSLVLTTSLATPPGVYGFSIVGSGDDCTALTRVALEVEADRTPPVLTLIGADPYFVECCIESFEDPGATAIDDVDGDISANIIVSGSVETTMRGDYVLTYSVADAAGNEASITRTVTVQDTTPPMILCPPPVTLEADAACHAVVPDLTTSADVSDACSSIDEITVSQSPVAGSTVGLGDHTVTLTAVDAAGNSASCTTTLTVIDVTPPDVTITAPASGYLTPIDEAVEFLGSFAECGSPEASTPEWIISRTGMSDTTITGTVFSVTNVIDEISFSEAGIYSITLVVTDGDGNTGHSSSVYDPATSNDLPAYIVVYDPDGGFVTGGGWIWSPVGAFHPELEEFAPVEGRANFGFVAKYKKGATIPTGQTEFQFKAGDLNFHSSSYDWLVVAGKRAMFKGVGSINGADGYGFMLTGIDGDVIGKAKEDRFRIKIWYTDENDVETLVYDNQAGSGDDAELGDATILRGGNIVIHKR